MTVLQSWLEGIPIRMQSTLLLGLRGPDGPTPMPNVKSITRWLRGLAFKPGNPDNVMEFMNTEKWPCGGRIEEKGSAARELEFCSQHFYSHLMHALEVVAYRHPDQDVRYGAYGLFRDMCYLFHLSPEPVERFEDRLCTRSWPGQAEPQDAQEALAVMSAFRNGRD